MTSHVNDLVRMLANVVGADEIVAVAVLLNKRVVDGAAYVGVCDVFWGGV